MSQLRTTIANSPPWGEKTSLEKYHTMGSWFLGSRGENGEIMKEKMSNIVDSVVAGRRAYFRDDPEFITKEMIKSADFADSIAALKEGIDFLGQGLADHSVPFFSPRYAAHMSFDVSMPAVLGYLIAQQYNQNNVTPEASPFTSFIEWQVGQDLCAMLGYNIHRPESTPKDIVGWGHITAGGSIANLESIWIARNLKYYPLSLQLAIAPGNLLSFIAPTFEVELCDKTRKNFSKCDPWDLLNLTPTEIADIPGRLFEQYSITSETLADELQKYSIQNVGKDYLDRVFKIEKVPQYLLSVANHYSWPKGCAIAGIGRDNLITVDVTNDARLDPVVLEKELMSRLQEKRAVYCVVAIVGTTEHGAVDPVREILAIRQRMQAKGMSFMVHADAAWGGYFTTKVTRGFRAPTGIEPYAFSIPLTPWTNEQLAALGGVDTITLDPHKSGFIPYPGGSLCLRDDRHRFLTTWASPYINVSQGNDYGMGIYGVLGSKPGAAPAATWLSHRVIGLHDGAYGDLLGTAMFTGVKMYGHWATMSLKSTDLTVTPLNMLPVEREAGVTPEKIRAQQQEILDKIVNRENDELEHDADAMRLVLKIGSDTMINAFVCNFKVDGVINTDPIESNFLNTRLFQRLSMTSLRDELNDRPIIILRTELKQSEYKGCLDKFKTRAGLKTGPENLTVLSNVSMTPFPASGQFLNVIMDAFRETAEQEIKNCMVRIKEQPAIHNFLIHGNTTIYLSYLPMFNVKNHRRNLILSVTMSHLAWTAFKLAKADDSNAFYTVHTKSSALGDLKILDKILSEKKFVGDLYKGLPTIYGSNVSIKDVEFTITGVHVNEVLDHSTIKAYPSAMPFILYGNAAEYHIEHTLQRAPNVQLIANGVKLDVPIKDSKYTLTFDTKVEKAMQPFTSKSPPDFFAPNATFDVTLQEEGSTSTTKAQLTLPSSPGDIYRDYQFINEEIAADIYIAVPKSSTVPVDQAKREVDQIADTILRLFKADTAVNPGLTWEDNIAHSLGRRLPLSLHYSVTLGRPDLNSIKPDAHFAIVSRFVSKYPTQAMDRKLVNQKEFVEKFHRLSLTIGAAKKN